MSTTPQPNRLAPDDHGPATTAGRSLVREGVEHPEHLAHRIGDRCKACGEIRQEGPAEPRNPLARLIVSAKMRQADYGPIEYSRKQTPRRRSYPRHGVSEFLRAVRTA